MPRYYFDVIDGDGHRFDDEGAELPDEVAARRAAETALPRIASDLIAGRGEHVVLTMKVRDEFNRHVLEATLEWKVCLPPPN